MSRFNNIFKGSIEEVREHVTWPSYQELTNSTVLVLIASIVFALVIGLMDFGFKQLMQAIYGFNA